MTPPVPPTPPPATPAQAAQLAAQRPSTAVVAAAHTESILNEIAAKVVAIVGLVFFGYLTFLEAKSVTPSNVRLALGVVPTVLCLAMLCTDQFVGVLQRLLPLVPARWRGGEK